MAALFTKFDPRTFLETKLDAVTTGAAELATLATLAAGKTYSEKTEQQPNTSNKPIGGIARAVQPAAKAAKAAKAANIVEGPGTASHSPCAQNLAAKVDARAPDIRGDEQEQGAAIVDGIPRTWAEGFARLDLTRPPADVPPRRWRQFIDDCGRFLDSGWANRAAELGWGPLNLFGCDRYAPFARVDHSGLLWLLDGNELIDLQRDKGVVQFRSGSRQTYYRCPLEVGRVVLAWELAQ